MASSALEILAENVRRLRAERGLSQMRLAELCDLHMTDISRIEKLKRDPGVKILEKVAFGLSVPVAELFEEAETSDRGEGSNTPR